MQWANRTSCVQDSPWESHRHSSVPYPTRLRDFSAVRIVFQGGCRFSVIGVAVHLAFVRPMADGLNGRCGIGQ